MTLTLRPEHELLVDRAIDAGVIGTADEVLDAGVEAIRRKLDSRARQSMIDAAADRLLQFGDKHHLSLAGLSLKELIDEGRR